MDVTVQKQVGEELTVLIEGAESYDAVLDAFYVGLRSHHPDGKGPSVSSDYRLYVESNGSYLLVCYPRAGVGDTEIVSELKFQLRAYARTSC
jgi:hypothetical protein